MSTRRGLRKATHSESHVQRRRVRQRAQVPALLAHSVADGVDVQGLTGESHHGDLRITKNIEIVPEACLDRRGERSRSGDDRFARVGVAAGG